MFTPHLDVAFHRYPNIIRSHIQSAPAILIYYIALLLLVCLCQPTQSTSQPPTPFRGSQKSDPSQLLHVREPSPRYVKEAPGLEFVLSKPRLIAFISALSGIGYSLAHTDINGTTCVTFKGTSSL
ncbi:hypothetical protein HGRIS_001325 [Hohenbuehelia grisea]|uniref:Uncharacterized protein n=1 Tax=Hohenbuehelia grisea TaxID=104357 RepID=A0ABR3JQV0_9AGAR